MCGFTGFLERSDNNPPEQLAEIVTRMTATLVHRGPDDGGIWTDPSAGVALGHRRLSILDLSPAGHQPMLSGNGRYVIAFNGEIYNHQDLRRKLGSEPSAPDHPLFDRQSEITESRINNWRGHSDTETLLAAIEAWGVDETLKQSVGMFAFACSIWHAIEWAKNRSTMVGRAIPCCLVPS
jgi:asparagine synthase (glutamine-hydrolysing)